MGPCRRAGEDSTRRSPLRQKVRGRPLDGQPLHLAGSVSRTEQAAVAPEELHGLEQSGTHGASSDGESQGVYQVASALLPFGGEASHCLLYRRFRPLGECFEAFDEHGEGLAYELLAELLLELGFVVVERAAVEVTYRVGDLGRQRDALLQEMHDVLEAGWVPFELLLRRRAGLDEHGGGESGEFF